MRKLRMDVEELAVESFDTASSESGEGTVFGHSYSGTRWAETCDENYTCAQRWTCGGGASCGYTCNNDDTCGGEHSCDINCPGEVVISFGWGA